MKKIKIINKIINTEIEYVYTNISINNQIAVKAWLTLGYHLNNLHADNYNTLLHVAVKYQNLQIVKILLDKGVNVNYVNPRDNTVPIRLATKGSEIYKLLIDNGAKI